jgi:hypothetical protein
MKKLIVFDLDGSHAPSKSSLAIPAEVAGVVSIPVKVPDDTNLVVSTILACPGDK